MRENEMTGIVFSNMHDDSLGGLTAERAFASVPFGARYRLIDFALSNMANSGVSNIGVITRHNYRSLMQHIDSGKPWDLSRKNGGIKIISPFGKAQYGVYHNRLQALYGARDFLSTQSSKYVILSDCNTVINLDVADMLSFHIKNEADITIASKKQLLKGDERKSASVLKFDEGGRVRRIYSSPTSAGEYDVDLNIWIIEKNLLEKLIDEGQSNGYKSFTDEVLRDNLTRLRVMAYLPNTAAFGIFSPETFFNANMALLTQESDGLFEKNRPIYTKIHDDAPAVYGKNAEVSCSLIADGCVINGKVSGSVVFRNTTVENGAEVADSIIMDGGCVCSGASVRCAVVDKNVTVKSGCSLSGDKSYPLYIRKGRTI